MEVAFVDEGCTGEKTALAAEGEGIRLELSFFTCVFYTPSLQRNMPQA